MTILTDENYIYRYAHEKQENEVFACDTGSRCHYGEQLLRDN